VLKGHAALLRSLGTSAACRWRHCCQGPVLPQCCRQIRRTLLQIKLVLGRHCYICVRRSCQRMASMLPCYHRRDALLPRKGANATIGAWRCYKEQDGGGVAGGGWRCYKPVSNDATICRRCCCNERAAVLPSGKQRAVGGAASRMLALLQRVACGATICGRQCCNEQVALLPGGAAARPAFN
jgi:hypothetical protein